MPAGSTYAALKAAIVERLQARSALSAVSVLYRPPERADEVAGESGVNESIWLDEAAGDHTNVVFGGLPLCLDESYSLALVIQVLRPTSDGEQQVADERVDELLYEVLSELAHDPSFGVDAPEFDLVQVTYSSFTRTGGFLQSGSGHAAGAELELAVQARINFTED